MAQLLARFSWILPFALLFSFKNYAQTILIDPGHGGSDLGAVAHLPPKKIPLYEKDIALRLALLVKKKLNSRYMVYLTRTEDYPVSLHDRALMADKVKADIFLSIHFNSSTEKEAAGIETFYLDNHQDKAVKKVESVENVGLESGNESSVINHILIELAIKMTSRQSKILAKYVHEHSWRQVKKKFPIKNRGFKPGLLYVLALSKRPGVLIEAGFLSNPKELSLLRKEKYLENYAQGIAEGLNQYFLHQRRSQPKAKPKKAK